MVQQKRRKPRKTARFLNMLLLVFAFLVVFEGRLIINIASKGGINKQVDEQLNKIFSSSDFQNQDEATAESETSSETASKYPANVTPFVNGAGSTSTSSVTVDDRCIVKKRRWMILTFLMLYLSVIPESRDSICSPALRRERS